MNAIDLEVIYQSTLQIARELTLNMLRTGYSTIIKESQDFTFAIFDAGRADGGAGHSPAAAYRTDHRAGARGAPRLSGRIEPGDAFIVNHPYRACQNHATDVTIVSPMFESGRSSASSATPRTSPISAARCPAPTAATPPTCSRKG